jgi:ribosomal protein L9
LSLRGKKIVIAARATEKGGLFKAITAHDIARAVRAEYSLEIPEAAIHLPEHMKTIGEHTVGLASKTQKSEITAVITATM